MGKHNKQQKFSATWVTQTQLGEHFSMTAREIGKKLIELGLRTYDQEQHQYGPTQEALSEGLCTATPLKDGTPFYMWHKGKVSQLLQEKTSVKPLSDQDVEYREIALHLIQAEKDARAGYDKVYYLLFDSISPKELPTVMAWMLIEAHKRSTTSYQSMLDSISAEDFTAINRQLERLGTDIRLGEEYRANSQENGTNK